MAIGNIDSDDFLDVWIINNNGHPLQLQEDHKNKIFVDIYSESPVFPRDKRPNKVNIAILLAQLGLLGTPFLLWLIYRDRKRYKAALAVAKLETREVS